MKNYNDKMVLSDEVLNDFSAIYNMSKELNDFYKKFNEEKIKNIDKKEVMYIKKHYWIDTLKGINLTIEPYSDYEFTIK